MNETDAFDAFHQGLKLDPRERLRAEKCHNDITAHLLRAGLIVSAFLQGSFARKTMIRPLRDIDKVVILAEALRGLSPDQVMDRLQAVLCPAYPDATFDRTRHSLKIDFGNGGFCFDVVPAWESETVDDDVMIANRDTGEWDRSNTRTLLRVVAKRNEDCGGRFIHTVRMIKHLVSEHLDEVIPGLHVESIAYASITTSVPYAVGCANVLRCGAALLGGDYSDPTGVDQISDKLKPEQRAAARSAFQRAASQADEAHRLAEAGDQENSLRVWHDLFGEPFPTPPAQQLGAALAAASAGSVTRSGHTSRTRAADQQAPPARAWQRDA